MRKIALTLHAHLPFYSPELDQPAPVSGGLLYGSRWLLENVVECYLPLLRSLKRLESESSSQLNLSVSPVLMAQLKSAKTKGFILAGLRDLIDRAKSDARGLDGVMKREAEAYRGKFSELLEFYLSIDQDMVGEFSRLTNVELMTTALTHAFLPLLKYHDTACAFQIREAARYVAKQLGKGARGFWFPEMGYTPYMREVVSENFDYFLVAPSAVVAWDRNAYQNRMGVRYGVVDSGISGFIWHPMPQVGEPSLARSAVYREFFRWDSSSGLKYWSITGEDVPLGDKAPYSSVAAAKQLTQDVADCCELLGRLRGNRLLAMDGEFFGHHWYEGSDFLYLLLKHSQDHNVEFVRNSELLASSQEEVLEVEPCESCWGTADIWMGPGRIAEVRNDILARTERALAVFQAYRKEKDHYRRMLLNRLLRELVVIQASDYAFAIYTHRASEYYDQVMAHHRASFDALADEIVKTCSYCERKRFLPTLRRIASINCIFRDLDYTALTQE